MDYYGMMCYEQTDGSGYGAAPEPVKEFEQSEADRPPMREYLETEWSEAEEGRDA